MKKIFTLILIFSLTMQIFAQDKLEKGVGDIATVMKYESEKATILAPLLLNIFLSLGIGSFVQGDYIGGGALLGSQVLGGILIMAGHMIVGIGRRYRKHSNSNNRRSIIRNRRAHNCSILHNWNYYSI
ncbi:conserved hypothetical protein (plasmid) [Borreliella burgdorferi JD1]|nr:conserved hypothetical protein [Borreliella burgdorferi JD1]